MSCHDNDGNNYKGHQPTDDDGDIIRPVNEKCVFNFQEFLRDVFSACLFDLPRDCYDDKTLPLCKHKVIFYKRHLVLHHA